MLSKRAHIERSGVFLLAVLFCGMVAAPFGHDVSHIRSLEHAQDPAEEAGSELPCPHGASEDFLSEEQAPSDHFECDLCALRSLAASVIEQIQAPALPVHVTGQTLRFVRFARSLSHRSIRAPPAA
ncbi:MAG: hypothetical protein F4Y00_05150 [Bacteroidetes bacterium SB0662_bin_6]|nr:hypothetical protein [Bacteroidetes bacterium SB0668_bin_1]MYE04342.1 hypothetical protein [Bacteroidetes bacterium SB0662_bin_6]